MRLVWCLLLSGCATDAIVDPAGPGDTGSVEEPHDPVHSQCGAVTTWDLVLVGRARTDDGSDAVGAVVTLEDRGWTGETLGAAITDATGAYTMDATGVTAVDGCWGTVLDYVLVGEEGELYGERGVNSALHVAIDDGSLRADGAVLVLDPPG